MNVTSKELCQELYELSGWEEDTHDWWGENKTYLAPRYTLGYLLRKLHDVRPPNKERTVALDWFGEKCEALSFGLTAYEATPEDATAKLAIELFKQGVLTK